MRRGSPCQGQLPAGPEAEPRGAALPRSSGRASSSGRAPRQPRRLARVRAWSHPTSGWRALGRLPPELTAPPSSGLLGLSGSLADALAYSPPFEVAPGGARWPAVKRVAVVGGGPAGLAAAIALIRCCGPQAAAAPASRRAKAGDALGAVAHPAALPRLAVTVFEKREAPVRRQHVFVDFGRLCDDAAIEVRLDVPRLAQLLAAHGARMAPGASVELRVLELCLWQLLLEVARAAAGAVAVRLEQRPFRPASDLRRFDDVVGADGRRSGVRDLIACRLPRVHLAQCALQVEFAYNCHLEWQEAEKVHTLKAHRYQAWRPILLYQPARGREHPEYVEVARADFEAVRRRFRRLSEEGLAPFTSAFGGAAAFLALFADDAEVQKSLREALERGVAGFDPEQPALIAPVEQTLHRALRLVAPSSRAGPTVVPALWLLGDAAVGLPVSKGCNLVYHVAAAGKLASSLLAGGPGQEEYEAFVFRAWHREAWREGRAMPTLGTGLACFGPRHEGRFTG